MPENRKQLISKLKSLNPIDGWYDIDKDGYLHTLLKLSIEERNLITLAPIMREELLRMEEEMEKLKQENDRPKQSCTSCHANQVITNGYCNICGAEQ